MGDRLSPISHRTANGFGEVTNSAILESTDTFRRHCPPLQAAAKILNLPDELRLEIALFVDATRGNQVLRNLALTCRRFRNVAQEALIRNVVLTPKAVRRYLNVLYEHPEHLQRLRSIELHMQRVDDRYLDRPLLSQDPSFIGGECYEACCGLLDRITKPSYCLDWAGELSVNEHLSRSAYIAVLVLVIPRLNSLFVTDSFIQQSTILSSILVRQPPNTPVSYSSYSSIAAEAISGRQSVVFKCLASELRILEIIDAGLHDRHFSLDFTGLLSLRRLSVSAKNIVYVPRADPWRRAPHKQVSEPTDILPKGLECLDIYVREDRWDCGYVLLWLEKLHDHRQEFPSLCSIRLFFKVTLQYFQTDMIAYTPKDHGLNVHRTLIRRKARDQLVLLQKLEESNIDLQLYFLKKQGQRVLDRTRAATGDDVVPSWTTPEPEPSDLCNFHQVRYNDVLETAR